LRSRLGGASKTGEGGIEEKQTKRGWTSSGEIRELKKRSYTPETRKDDQESRGRGRGTTGKRKGLRPKGILQEKENENS